MTARAVFGAAFVLSAAGCTDAGRDHGGVTSCVDCAVDVVLAGRFGGPESRLPGLPIAVERAPNGDLLVIPGPQSVLRSEGVIPIFSSSGTFRGFLARKGQGPAELRPRINERLSVVVSGSRLQLVSARRIDVFDASYAHLNSTALVDPLPPLTRVRQLSSGGYVANPLSEYFSMNQRGDTSVRSVLTVRSDSGAVLLERRLETIPELSGSSTRLMAVCACLSESGFWLATTHHDTLGAPVPGYRVTRFSEDGSPLDSHVRLPEFWRSSESASVSISVSRAGGQVSVSDGGVSAAAQVEPGTALSAVYADSRNRLHVLLSHSAADRDSNVPELGIPSDYDTVLEILDAGATRIVGRAVLPGRPVGMVDDSTVATYAEDSLGAPWLAIWTLHERQVPMP